MKKILFILLIISPLASAVPLQQEQYKIGDAKFKYLFWKIYNSSLYAPEQKFVSLDQELTLSIEYQRNIPKQRIINATINQWEHLEYTPDQIDKWSEKITKVIPEIKKNDKLTFYKDKFGVGKFYFNNQFIAEIEDKAFSESFLSIWLSKNTSEPKLRKKLIGG